MIGFKVSHGYFLLCVRKRRLMGEGSIEAMGTFLLCVRERCLMGEGSIEVQFLNVLLQIPWLHTT